VAAPRLGSVAIAEAVRRAHVPPERVDEVYMGIILAAGLGQAPARQASIYAGLPNTVPATTLNKMCGSGLKAVMLGAQAIQAGDADIIVAGGMENMSAAPYLLDRARAGYRIGHGALVDSMIKDGLWDVYTQMHMGNWPRSGRSSKKAGPSRPRTRPRSATEPPSWCSPRRMSPAISTRGRWRELRARRWWRPRPSGSRSPRPGPSAGSCQRSGGLGIWSISTRSTKRTPRSSSRSPGTSGSTWNA